MKVGDLRRRNWNWRWTQERFSIRWPVPIRYTCNYSFAKRPRSTEKEGETAPPPKHTKKAVTIIHPQTTNKGQQLE